jgi:Tfp pilus assembly protein PilX
MPLRRISPSTHRDTGSALVLALVATVLLGGLGFGLAVLGNTESTIATNYHAGSEALYAAEAGAERVISDASFASDWTALVSGAVRSAFVDQTLTPVLPSNERVDLTAMTRDLQSASDAAIAVGLNNPQWRLFAYGPLTTMIGPGLSPGRSYVVVWVADDRSETDNNPAIDSNGTMVILARALGPAGAARTVEVTIAKVSFGVRILSWREIR